MRKTLLTTLAAALAASAAFAEVPLKALKDLPKDAYIPADVTFIEGADDETGGVDFTGKLADIAADIQAKAQERGWTEAANEVGEDSAKFEYKKMNGDELEYSINYVLLPEGGKTQIEVVFLDERK